jgi:hypothetical protein
VTSNDRDESRCTSERFYRCVFGAVHGFSNAHLLKLMLPIGWVPVRYPSTLGRDHGAYTE